MNVRISQLVQRLGLGAAARLPTSPAKPPQHAVPGASKFLQQSSEAAQEVRPPLAQRVKLPPAQNVWNIHGEYAAGRNRPAPGPEDGH